MSSQDKDPPAGEQHAFSDAFQLIGTLVGEEGYDEVDVGTGVLIAALSVLRKRLSEEEIAKILYEYADDYATRKLSNG